MTAEDAVAVEPVGSNAAKLWGLTPEQRLRRMAAAQGLRAAGGEARILVNLDYVFDPAWLRWIAERPGHAVTRAGRAVLAHCPDEATAAALRSAMGEGQAISIPALTIIEQETFGALHDVRLRKREQPFMERLTEATAGSLERRSYYASYKGVTDLLTKYLWPEWALQLTRLATRLGIPPNAVTIAGIAFCIGAGIAFYGGRYWTGMAAALVFMVLDTVDGKLARCTITASRLGDVLDHGTDLVHPPLWWWAWGAGLAAYGRPLEPDLHFAALAAIVLGYCVQRGVEGLFIAWFRIEIHVWRRADSRFRLVTARRNPNMVILFASLVAGRPDLGLVAVAGWTVFCCLFHIVRLLQARIECRREGEVVSWLG